MSLFSSGQFSQGTLSRQLLLQHTTIFDWILHQTTIFIQKSFFLRWMITPASKDRNAGNGRPIGPHPLRATSAPLRSAWLERSWEAPARSPKLQAGISRRLGARSRNLRLMLGKLRKATYLLLLSGHESGCSWCQSRTNEWNPGDRTQL